MRSAWSNILAGFMWGIGFSLSFTTLLALVLVSVRPEPALKRQYAPESGLAISEHRSSTEDNEIVVLGTIRNDDDQPWRSIIIGVDLFNDGGESVWNCQEPMFITVFPKTQSRFMVQCPRRWDREIGEFSRYEVSIMSATSP